MNKLISKSCSVMLNQNSLWPKEYSPLTYLMLFAYLILTTHELLNSIIICSWYSCSSKWCGPCIVKRRTFKIVLLLICITISAWWVACTCRRKITTTRWRSTNSPISRRNVRTKRSQCERVLCSWGWSTGRGHNRGWIWGRRSRGWGSMTNNHWRWRRWSRYVIHL